VKKPAIVDADGHVVEPPELLGEYIEPAFRDRIPEYVRDGDREYLIPRDPTISRTPGWFPQEKMFVVCAPNNAGRPWSEAGRPFREGIAGAWDPHARIKDMDVEGIDVAVLYPTYALGYVEDAALQSAAYRAYNTWLHDYCTAYPKRLFGVAAVALQDPEGAARELRRCVKEYGFRGAFIRPNSYIEGRKLNDPVYDPFWREAAALDVAIGLHPYLMADMPGAVLGLGLEAREDIFFKQALGNPVDMMSALVAFTAGGIFERFPKIRVAFLEANGGWIVPMLERLDHHFEIWRAQVDYLKHKPSELFMRNGFISFDADEKLLCTTAGHIGADRIIWASDYPHPDAKMPGVVNELRETLAPLPPPDQETILGGSAARLYDLSL
jgi:predicted TIM-barrel fold metal-dependent hydrolase